MIFASDPCAMPSWPWISMECPCMEDTRDADFRAAGLRPTAQPGGSAPGPPLGPAPDPGVYRLGFQVAEPGCRHPISPIRTAGLHPKTQPRGLCPRTPAGASPRPRGLSLWFPGGEALAAQALGHAFPRIRQGRRPSRSCAPSQWKLPPPANPDGRSGRTPA